MQRKAYTLLKEAEGSWWYRGRARVIRAMLKRAGVSLPVRSVLDFGVGNGASYTDFAQVRGAVDAFEPDEEARAGAALRGYRRTYETAEEALARPAYDLIGLCDVLEHIRDDVGVLQSVREALTPGGTLVITVPAFGFLWGEHDTVHHHFRRYNRRGLKRVLEEAGYEIRALSYWNTLLFIPAALVRLAGRSGSSALHLPKMLDVLLFGLIAGEAALLSVFSSPLGLSLVAIARKKERQPLQ